MFREKVGLLGTKMGLVSILKKYKLDLAIASLI